MSLGELSTVLVWGAVTAYAVAFVAFAADLARRAEAAARPARRAADEASGAETTLGGGAASAPGHTATALAPDPDAGVPGRWSGRALGIAMATTTLGLALHVAGAVLRGVAAGRVPWANMYEFALIGTLAAVATFRILCLRRDVRFLGTPVLGLSVIALGLGLAAFYVPADAVEPALQSYWLVIHVSIATIATGVFTVGVAASVLQLLRDSWENGSPRMVDPRWRVLAALPSARALEALSFRLNAVGFVLWTFTVMAGAIWAEHAWGRYWGWDPKEVWSFVVWVVYAAYLHARTTRGWSGRRAAWFVVVGYATVIFNFTGVNLLFGGLHAYSGLPVDE
ncbi:MAG TPA: c-type cytochrome biogenesis protein CcsB [Actinotalea sp.]|nr:c-type cytochrome biogenesis protein CcsB [Actinotalea sp.]